MKAAQLYAYDKEMNVDLKIETVPEPTISDPEDVIVRVGAAGLCRTDLHIIEGVWRDVMDAEGALLPYIMGHENAGWVIDGNPARRKWREKCTMMCGYRFLILWIEKSSSSG